MHIKDENIDKLVIKFRLFMHQGYCLKYRNYLNTGKIYMQLSFKNRSDERGVFKY